MEVQYLLSFLNAGTNRNRTTLDAILMPATRHLNKMPGDQLLLDIPKKLKNKYIEWINIQLASGRLDSAIFDLIQKEVDGISNHALEKLDVPPEEPKRFIIQSKPMLEEEEFRETTGASNDALKGEPVLTQVSQELRPETHLKAPEAAATKPVSNEKSEKAPVESVVIQDDPDDKKGLANIFG